MKKITFIGAGSWGFTRGLVKDILTFPALEECELCLMDINSDRLNMAKTAVERIVNLSGKPAKVTTTMDILNR